MSLYPTRQAIVLAMAGAPLALLLAAFAPTLWTVGAAWVLLAAVATAADAALAAAPQALRLEVRGPPLAGVGRTFPIEVRLRFTGRAPRQVEVAAALNERLTQSQTRIVAPVAGGSARIELAVRARRRGIGRLASVWARWRGPLGLAWRQRHQAADLVVPVSPDLQSLREEGLRLFARDAPLGLKTQIDPGEGAEFHALKAYQSGMDLRGIDWKQSARHGRLIGREFTTERNHSIILALDSGHLMSAPLAGLARIDHAVHAALLLAFTGLKLGDRVGLFSFDARPRVGAGVVSGLAAFPTLRRLAADVDYSTEETNFTLGLTSLAGRLDRRALVVLFTDFADATSATLMVENLGRLARNHLILLVTFRHAELAQICARAPEETDDVVRAVIADTLLKQRQGVLHQLERLGVQILEAEAGQIGPALIGRYLDMKRRELV